MFDKDKNGTISKQELRNFFETTEKKDEEMWTDIFKEVDADGDGEITWIEFKEAMTKVIFNSSKKDRYLVRNDTVDTQQLRKI
jgi:calcium-dependent protein kinase